jgi:hypothetical protein
MRKGGGFDPRRQTQEMLHMQISAIDNGAVTIEFCVPRNSHRLSVFPCVSLAIAMLEW